MSTGVIRVGISGWTFAPWRGVFYPTGLKREEELAYAASRFPTIEINGTFYGPQHPEAFASWTQQVAADFVFTVKGPRYITHVRRLRDVEVPLANFLASGLLRMGSHLGPILWQFPPNFRFQPDLITLFLGMLPRDTEQAADLGRKHDSKLRSAAWVTPEVNRRVRHAFEIRHHSFRCQEFIDLLRVHDVALVCADPVTWPRLMDITADFVYCRLHGSARDETRGCALASRRSPGLCANGYDNASLDQWSRRVLAWAAGEEPADAERVGGKARPRKRDVFVFFDNDKKVRAPANAMELIRRLRS